MHAPITILKTEILSDNWYVLRKVTYTMRHRDGSEQTHSREAYDRGNGATILLYNRQRGTVILTRQFRLPTYLNGNSTGLLIETCAGLLDADEPEACIRREVAEETGFHIGEVKKIFQAYMSPGSVTEIVHFFIAEYEHEQRIDAGGGVEDEDIEVLELDFSEALDLMAKGEICDGKTIMLLQYAQIHGVFS